MHNSDRHDYSCRFEGHHQRHHHQSWSLAIQAFHILFKHLVVRPFPFKRFSSSFLVFFFQFFGRQLFSFSRSFCTSFRLFISNVFSRQPGDVLIQAQFQDLLFSTSGSTTFGTSTFSGSSCGTSGVGGGAAWREVRSHTSTSSKLVCLLPATVCQTTRRRTKPNASTAASVNELHDVLAINTRA